MKKSFIFGAALMLAGAFGLQSCSQETNAGSPTMDEATYDAQTLTFKAFIEKHAVDGVVTLPASAVFTMEEAIEFTEPLTITTDAKKPATIIAKAGFVISDAFTLENVKIDASESTKAIISLATTPAMEAVNDCYFIDIIALKNTEINGVQSYLIDNPTTNRYVVKDLTIEGAIVKLATPKEINALIRLDANQSGVKDLTIKNSTFYQTGTSNPKFFVQYSQGDPARWKLADEETWSFNYYNNTFYKVTSGNWANTSRTNNVMPRTIFNVENNIWVDCGNGQTAQRMLNQRTGHKVANFLNNTYWKDGDAVDQSSYDKSGTALTSDPAFKDAANGDFTPTGADQVAKLTGDPRWFAIQ